jgi:hypothetical protein
MYASLQRTESNALINTVDNASVYRKSVRLLKSAYCELSPCECISVCMPTGGTPLFLPPLAPPYKNAKLRRKRPARL